MTPPSKTASTKYRELHKYDYSPYWVFRKYSKEKRGEFIKSTGILAEERQAATAYKKGIELFNNWLGTYLPTGRQLQIKDVARAVLAAKETKKGGKLGSTYRSAKNQIENHIVPAFGHLRPDQVTSLRWEQYISEQRRMGKDRRFFNMRKFLLEILRRSEQEGHCRRVPKLVNPDTPPAPPKYLARGSVRAILKCSNPTLKLLAFIMWKQGARPGEVLQYEWSMIHWAEGKHGTIHIPGRITKTGRTRAIPLNSRVARVLKYLEARQASRFIFPSPMYPDRPIREYGAAWERVRDAAKVDATIYNLRDTFITERLLAGQSSTFIGKYVDSSTTMIDRNYAVAVRSAMMGVAG